MFWKNSFNTFFAVALVALLLFNSGGYLMLFAHWHRVREEMITEIQQGIHAEDLVEVRFEKDSVPEMIWFEEDEFRYKGQMYDVISSCNLKNETIYYCYKDTKETDFFPMLNKLIQHMKNQRKKSGYKIIKLFRYAHTVPELQKHYFQRKEFVADSYRTQYKSLPKEIITPPPKV